MLQQRIARPLDGFGRRRPQAVLLRAADGVDRVGRQPLDVKPVVDHPGLRHPRPHRLAVARRQVRRHQFDPGTAGRSQQLEELVERFRAAPRPGPDHAPAVMVDHHRQIVVPLPIAELVDPDPPQPGQPRRVQPASHPPLDDAADRRPRDVHQATRRRPVRHLRQIRRQLLERRRERAAVRRPRHLLDPNPAASARHSPRRIPQPHRYPTPRQMAGNGKMKRTPHHFASAFLRRRDGGRDGREVTGWRMDAAVAVDAKTRPPRLGHAADDVPTAPTSRFVIGLAKAWGMSIEGVCCEFTR